MAQKSFQWNNRLVIIQVSEIFDVEKQLGILNTDTKALLDRRIKIFVKTEEGYFEGSNLQPVPQKATPKAYETAKFFSLFGLDGGLKFESDESVSIEKLKSLIDAMPMRQSEMRKSQNK